MSHIHHPYRSTLLNHLESRDKLIDLLKRHRDHILGANSRFKAVTIEVQKVITNQEKVSDDFEVETRGCTETMTGMELYLTDLTRDLDRDIAHFSAELQKIRLELLKFDDTGSTPEWWNRYH